MRITDKERSVNAVFHPPPGKQSHIFVLSRDCLSFYCSYLLPEEYSLCATSTCGYDIPIFHSFPALCSTLIYMSYSLSYGYSSFGMTDKRM
jgi:hypothetical protein